MHQEIRSTKQYQKIVFMLVLTLITLLASCDGDSNNVTSSDEGSACTQVPLPTASIVVDGDPGDWAGIAEALTDPQGDDSPDYTGDDIQALYIAKDAEQLYIRMDLWENANWGFGNGPSDPGRYVVHVQCNTIPDRFDVGIAGNGVEWSLGWNGSSSGPIPPELEGPEFVEVQNNVIELRIPLAVIGNPNTFSLIMGRSENCCATDPILTLDETDCVSAEM